MKNLMNNEIDDLRFKILDKAEYEERADYLNPSDLVKWTAHSQHFEAIQKKLIQIGAKLIVGPRGTGKTHQMRYAFFSCKEDNNKPLPVYVSFNHYLRLETYLHENSNAIGIFHAWVIAKIISATIEEGDDFESIDIAKDNLNEFISDIERQRYSDEHKDIVSILTVQKAKEIIEYKIEQSARKRAIVLLDDAALTLTNDYMIEFFDIFRSLKSTKISPKASVYPGTTQYGPRFHVGQDAEKVPVWINIEETDYLEFMHSIVESRFDNQINIDKDLKELLMYCSFGVPRAYIMFLSAYMDSNKKSTQAKFNSLIEEKCNNMLEEYNSISGKLPQYKNIIEIGEKLVFSVLNNLKQYNYETANPKGKANVVIGISEIDDKAERMLKFLIEAGILFELEPVSHGADRKIRRFIPHISLIIKEKALIKSRGFKASQLLELLTETSAKHPVRRKFNKILDKNDIGLITLNLPPCSNCNTPRIADGQKFCHVCGNELVDKSIFKTCMLRKLTEIPLTKFQRRVIKETPYETIEDVITADDLTAQLKGIKGVGRKYSEKIIKKINDWTNEFLY